MHGHAGRRLNVAVVGNPQGWHVGRLLAALEARGHVGTAVRWTELAAEIGPSGCFEPGTAATAVIPAAERFQPAAIAEADAVLVRGMPGGGLEEVVFRMDLLGRLAARGTPVVNSPRALEIAIDKYLSLSRLAAAGLPVPHTMVVQDPAAIESAWRSFGGDCIVKPLFGSGGRGIARITNRQDLAPLINAAAGPSPTGVAYLQEFVPHDGWDVRVLLVGAEVFCIRRVAAAGEWRTNVSLGGRPEAFDAPAEWIDLARAASETLGTRIAGVDLLPGRDGRVLVLEVNAVPGWKGLEAATGIPVADRVVRSLESF